MLLMNSTFRREASGILTNYCLLNAIGFALGAVQGTALLARSSDGSIPGWAGSQVDQVLWYAVAVVVFLPLTFGIPVLAVTSLAWRIAIELFGHARVAAYGIATVVVVGGAWAVPRADLGELALASVAVFAFATVVRQPFVRPWSSGVTT